MACLSGHSNQCTKKSLFDYFFTSQKQFAQEAKGAQDADKLERDRRRDAENNDPSRVDYNMTGVQEIGETDFKEFVAQQDVSLVLFYSKDGEDSAIAMQTLTQAAGITDRPYSAFAQVDCSKNYELCIGELITKIPTFKMYSKGATVGTIRDYATFPSQMMKSYVEKCPVLTQASRPTPVSYKYNSLKRC